MQLRYKIVERSAKLLRTNRLLKVCVYDPLKLFCRRRMCSFDYMLYYMAYNRQYKDNFSDVFDAGCKRIGIIRDPFNGHEPYIAACMAKEIGYRVIDIFSNEWISQVKASGCDVFLVWPGESIKEWKRVYDDRLRLLVESLGKKIFPDLTATWIYGSKERQHEWLELNGFDHPGTWIFYNIAEATKFINERDKYPIVAKTDIGAVASGVTILKSKREALIYLNHAFAKGVQGYYSDKQARQWRHVLFQEYLVNAKEWRVHRQDDSFFGFGKAKKGDFHSGSGETHWVPPPKVAFDLVWEITERGGFRSMAVDIFETTDGRFLVNELQCVYGQHCAVQLIKEGKSGRFLRQENGDWKFEEGVFSVNHGCNLRLDAALKL